MATIVKEIDLAGAGSLGDEVRQIAEAFGSQIAMLVLIGPDEIHVWSTGLKGLTELRKEAESLVVDALTPVTDELDRIRSETKNEA
jgi:phosphoglycerate dehydrogenase-like enzyme